MGWDLTSFAAEAPPAGEGSQSVTVTLIATLGTVAIALLALVGQWLARNANTSASPPDADPKFGERAAVLEVRVQDSTRTLDVLDRHVDSLGDAVERLTWRVDDLTGRMDEHNRRLHGQE